jgi:hypothetical protein
MHARSLAVMANSLDGATDGAMGRSRTICGVTLKTLLAKSGQNSSFAAEVPSFSAITPFFSTFSTSQATQARPGIPRAAR